MLQLRQAQLGDVLDPGDQTLRGEIALDGEDPLRGVLGEIADAFEIVGDVDRGDDFPQILGHRLTPGDHPGGVVLDLPLQLIHALVAGDDALGEDLVAARKRGDGVADLLFGDAAHFGDLPREIVQFVIEGGNDVLVAGHDRSVAQPKRPVM